MTDCKGMGCLCDMQIGSVVSEILSFCFISSFFVFAISYNVHVLMVNIHMLMKVIETNLKISTAHSVMACVVIRLFFLYILTFIL